MNAGVSMTPRLVVNLPQRAFEAVSVAMSSNIALIIQQKSFLESAGLLPVNGNSYLPAL
jgi:hypothetical protein